MLFSVFTQRISSSVFAVVSKIYATSVLMVGVCKVDEFGCVYLQSHNLHISILKMEAAKRRQYGPYPHCVRILELNQHQKIKFAPAVNHATRLAYLLGKLL